MRRRGKRETGVESAVRVKKRGRERGLGLAAPHLTSHFPVARATRPDDPTIPSAQKKMFTSSDLAASASRLKREQAVAAAREREKQARRDAEAARAAAARAAVEEEKRVARLAALQAEEEV